jgi:hypothetical protein
LKRARFSFLEFGKSDSQDQPDNEQDKAGVPQVKPVQRAIETDDELPLDRTGTEVVCHTCRSCGAENFPQSRVCRVCEGSLGGPGQAEYDLEMHNKKKQAAYELADQLERQKVAAKEKSDRIAREAEIAVRDDRLSTAKTRLWFWGIISALSIALVALLYIYLTPPQFLGLIAAGVVMYVSFRVRAASRHSTGRWYWP